MTTCRYHDPSDSEVRCTRPGTMVVITVSPWKFYGGQAWEWVYWCPKHAPADAEDAELARLLEDKLTTPEQAEAWIRAMHAAGYGTHPDDPAAEVVHAATREPLFTERQALLVDARMEEAFELLEDPYAVALEALNG